MHLPQVRLVVAENEEVIRVAQVCAVAFAFGDPVVERIEEKVPPELAGEIADGQPPPARLALHRLNLLLEQLRVLWRLCQDRGWISRQQLVFIVGKIDEAGRMIGGWRRSLGGETA